MNAPKIKRSFLFLLILLCSASCRLQLLPNYNQEIFNQIDLVTKNIDRFYLILLEEPEPQRQYSAFKESYIEIEVELLSLYYKNRLRPKNENTTKNCEMAVQKWRDYREAHKQKQVLTAGVINLNRKFMVDLLFTIYVAEAAKQ